MCPIRRCSRSDVLSTPPDLFTTVYHFDVGVSGLAYIGLGVGFVSATIVGASKADRIYQEVRVPTSMHYRGQHRLIDLSSCPDATMGRARLKCAYLRSSLDPCSYLSGSCKWLSFVIGACLIVPSSWYGWSAQAKVHWMMPIIGSGIFGFGMMTTL